VQPKPPEPDSRTVAPKTSHATEAASAGPVARSDSTPSSRAVAKADHASSIASGKGNDPASPAAPKGADGDYIESRFQATREWLAGAPQTTHTIQLLGTNSEAQLRGHLQSLSKVLEPGKLYVYRTMAQGKPSISVVYGAYSGRQSALQALDDLPSAAAAYKPVLRTVNGIRAELKQHGMAVAGASP
jgi:septal ring-binding cell division protein DamX